MKDRHPCIAIFDIKSSILSAFAAVMIAAGTATGQTEYFVATNGTDDGSNNGLSWTAPLLTIGNGIAKATDAGPGSIVTVSNGTYNITAQINVSASITVRSFGNGVYGGLANASNTIVTRASGNIRIFNIAHAAAVVQGLTITNGDHVGNGGGVYMTGGLVRDCIISGNRISGGHGMGVFMTGGMVSNCVITGHTKSGDGNGFGLGICVSNAGTIVACDINNNTWYPGTGGTSGGGVYVYSGASSAVIRNCLIRNNGVRSNPEGGGGVYLGAGTLENCTIVSNRVFNDNDAGGGVARGSGTGGTIRNCIVFDNIAANTAYTNIYSTSANNLTYTCTTSPAFTGNGNISNDPLFANRAAHDYTLLTGSPCIGAGTNQPWMVGAKDLAGNDRRLHGGVVSTKGSGPVVDMGAYERYVPPRGTVLILR